MKILSIGNSFSHDAQRYLSRIAKSEGMDFKTVNLYIGGCSLRTHYLNAMEDRANYHFEFNGENTGIQVSIKQALMSEEWDVVTLQQASYFSAKQNTYEPYIQTLADYVRKYCPHTKIFIHQTWAYEDGSDRLKENGYDTAKDMFEDIKRSYVSVAREINADGIIPCGQAMFNAVQLGIGKVHRDTFHATLGAGRYLLALTWFKALTNKDILNNRFADFDVPVSEEERKIIIQAVNSAF